MTTRSVVRVSLCLLLAALVSLVFPSRVTAQGESFVLKYACFAPEGSTYVNAMRAWDAELRSRSQGRVSFRIYGGGVQGDERDMLRKMRVGQLQLVGMTGIGLGQASPEIRVLEMPGYYRDYNEVDAVTRALEGRLEQGLRTRGYELLGWGEAGTVHIFSKQELKSISQLSRLKVWGWEGDQVSAEIFKVFKVSPVPLSLPDVLSSLQTGIVDSVYGSPLGVVALHWSSHLKYMTRQNLGRGMGGTVMDKRQYDRMPPDLQKLLKETGKKYHAQIVQGARADNEKALTTLARQGIKSVEIPPAEWAIFEKGAAQVRQNLTGTLWPADLVTAADAALAAWRAQAPAPR